MFLIVVDMHSKWLDVIPMKTATATALTTVQRLVRCYKDLEYQN